MKKIGEKLSFLTKIMLVIGLLISNLSSLSVVFAYEAIEDMVITLNEETLEISYTEELAEEVEAVNVKVYENYTYLDGTPETFGGTSEKEIVSVYSLTAEELLLAAEGKLELTYNSIFAIEEEIVSNYKLFDGTYSARVEIVDVTDYSEDVVDENDTIDSDENGTETLEASVETTEVENTETQEETAEEVVSEVLIAEGAYEKEIKHKSGLNIRLYDVTNNVEIVAVDGEYPVVAENSKVEVVAQILSGGLNPTDIFEYAGEELRASELIQKGFSNEFDFRGRLFGEYELPVEVKVLKQLLATEEVSVVVDADATEVVENTDVENAISEEEVTNENYEEVVYTDSVNVLYGSYELNSDLLNAVAEEEGYDVYLFNSEDKEGTLYVFSDFEEVNEIVEETTEEVVVTRTMLDLYNMLNVAYPEEDGEKLITYTFLKNGINVLETYVPAGEDDTIENYLSTIALDDTVQIILSNEGLSVTYNVALIGDLDNNNIITEDDLLELINQVVGESEITNIDKSDLYIDGEVNSLDVLSLNQVVKNQVWEATIVDAEVILDAVLEVKKAGEKISSENYLTSGDEFTVDYILSLTDYEVNGIAGVFNYDETLFELVSVEESNGWLGNNYEGKFLYLGEESLTGPEFETSESETEVLEMSDTEDAENEETIVPVDYVVLTATFRALKSTNEDSDNVISLEEIELFNSTLENVTYYVLDQNTVSTEAIEVVASDDNSLQYLEVAGIKIALEDGVYEYEITVPSDVTAVDLKYILGNVAASVTSTIYPEELAEGSNTIVLTVTSETGVSQDYTITVIREEVEETTTQVNYNNNYNNYEEEQEEVIVTPGAEEEDDDNKDDKDSNLSRIIIIILILVVIAGLVYLIFKDDDEETKKANKEVNKLKKESLEPKVNEVKKTSNNKTNTKSNNRTSNSKNKNSKNDSKNKRKER